MSETSEPGYLATHATVCVKDNANKGLIPKLSSSANEHKRG